MININMRLARNWLNKTKEPTMVHALRYLESGLKEWVDSMLLEQRAPYWIAKELWKRLHSEVENWQIPSRKSITIYRDRYFYKSSLFIHWLVKNSNDPNLKLKYQIITGEKL